jgi:hypothetical protein
MCSDRLQDLKWPSGIGLDSIRKVFLNPPSPPPDVESIQACLAIKMQEVERLKAELAEAKAVIETTLPAKERRIFQLTQEFSHLAAELRVTRDGLLTKDAEIRRLKERQVVAQPPSPLTISSTLSFNSALVLNGSRSERLHARTQVLPRPMERAMKRGTDILYRGYGCPKWNAVPECTARAMDIIIFLERAPTSTQKSIHAIFAV